MLNARINGIACMLCYDERIPQERAPFGYPYIYHLRHDEDDWTIPISVERFVAVNFFGTIFMKEPLEFGVDDYIEVKQFKPEIEYIKFKLSSALLSKAIGLSLQLEARG